MGLLLGIEVGSGNSFVGRIVGCRRVGLMVANGANEGEQVVVGCKLGSIEGAVVGEGVGRRVGMPVGDLVGRRVGDIVGERDSFTANG